VQYRTCFQLPNIPVERFASDAFVVMLLRMQGFLSDDNRMEVLYEVLLPHLVTAENSFGVESVLDTVNGCDQPDWTSAQRSGTCYYRAVLLAIKYFLWRRGVPVEDAKLFFLLIRLQFMVLVEADLRRHKENGQALEGWELSVIRTACAQLARATLKACKKSTSLFETMGARIQKVIAATLGNIGAAAAPRGLLGHLCLPETLTAVAQPLALGGHLFSNFSCEAFSGPAVLSVDSAAVSLLLPEVTTAELTLAKISSLLAGTLATCEALRSRAFAGNGALAMHHTCVLLENVFLEVLPVPRPPGEPSTESPCPWSSCSSSLTADCQHRVIQQLSSAMVTYVTAAKSLPEYDSLLGKQTVTCAVIYACLNAVARLVPISDRCLPISCVLNGHVDGCDDHNRLWCLDSTSFGGLPFHVATESRLMVSPVVTHKRFQVAQYWAAWDAVVSASPRARFVYTFETGVSAGHESDIIAFTAAYLAATASTGVPKSVFSDALGQLRSNVTTVDALSELERVGMWYASYWEAWPEFLALRTSAILYKLMLEPRRDKFCIPLRFWQTFQAVPHVRYTASRSSKDGLVLDIRVFSGFLGAGYVINFERR
jgi:hypothetical protein